MARFNEVLIGRWNRFFQKLTSIKGGPPSPQLASEITPVFEVEAISVEDRFLLGWNRYGFGATQIGGAANIAAFRFRNPANSNVIGVLESIEIVCNLADFINVTYGKIATDLVNAITPGAIDGRSGQGSSSIVFSDAPLAAASLLPRIAFLRRADSFSEQWIYNPNQEIPIAPGFALQVENVTVNLNLTVSAVWRERILEEGELK